MLHGWRSTYSAAAVQFAAGLAPDAALHVFHALDCSLEAVMRNAGVTEAGIAAYRSELEREANENMRELTAALKGRTVFETVQAGDPRALIRQQAAAGYCTLIVMGKQGRSWLSEHVLGSVTRLVLEHASCDVAVVPNGL